MGSGPEVGLGSVKNAYPGIHILIQNNGLNFINVKHTDHVTQSRYMKYEIRPIGPARRLATPYLQEPGNNIQTTLDRHSGQSFSTMAFRCKAVRSICLLQMSHVPMNRLMLGGSEPGSLIWVITTEIRTHPMK